MKCRPSCSPTSYIVQISGMIEGGSCTRFAAKTTQRFFIVAQLFRQKFERDQTPEVEIFRFIDNTHASAAELFEDAVMANGTAGHLQFLRNIFSRNE